MALWGVLGLTMASQPSTLIVEDEIFVALDLERILEDNGYDVVAIAADREEALAHAAGCEIAFVDVNLRDGATGPEIARDLSARGVKIVFVTANPAQIGPSANAAVCYVRKPFGEEAIAAAAAIARGEQASDCGGAVIRLRQPWSGG